MRAADWGIEIGPSELSLRYPELHGFTGLFNNFFDHLCWALYFDRYGRPFNESTHLMRHTYLRLHTEDAEELKVRAFLSEMMETFRKNHHRLITRYEAAKVDESVYANQIIDPAGPDGSITIMHTFYGIFEVVSMFSIKWLRVKA